MEKHQSKFTESLLMFVNSFEPIIKLNWSVENEEDNLYLECWTHEIHGEIIVKCFPNGAGFKIFKSL